MDRAHLTADCAPVVRSSAYCVVSLTSRVYLLKICLVAAFLMSALTKNFTTRTHFKVEVLFKLFVIAGDDDGY